MLAAKCGTFASSKPIALDVAKRLWNVSLPLADTAAGRAIVFYSLRSVLQELAKGSVHEGGLVRSQVNGFLDSVHARKHIDVGFPTE